MDALMQILESYGVSLGIYTLNLKGHWHLYTQLKGHWQQKINTVYIKVFDLNR